MRHLGTQVLRTPRLVLRPFSPEDAGAMFANWASDPNVTRFLTWPPHSSPENSLELLKLWASCYGDPTFYQWAIVPEEVGQPIGSISAVRQDEGVSAVEIGYCIGAAWWRRGYTSEALSEVIRFFMEEVGANRVSARHDPENPNSGRVMRHCNMLLEGTLRQAGRNNRGVCDERVYAILAEDYFSLHKGRTPPNLSSGQ